MMFCQKRYTQSWDFKKNISWNEYVFLTNESLKYCRRFNIFKWIEFYCWYKIRRYKPSDIPSYHPYWRLTLKISRFKKTYKQKLLYFYSQMLLFLKSRSYKLKNKIAKITEKQIEFSKYNENVHICLVFTWDIVNKTRWAYSLLEGNSYIYRSHVPTVFYKNKYTCYRSFLSSLSFKSTKAGIPIVIHTTKNN